MQKLLIYCLCGASLALSACSTTDQLGSIIPAGLESLPLMYKSDVQQGNVITQEMINRLEPGMSTSQVNYIMGSPMLVDVFHQGRWDYVYTMRRGKNEPEQKRIAIFFEDDRLVRITGDLKPEVPDGPLDLKEAEVITVPDNNNRDGIFTKVFKSTEKYLGLDNDR
ncbi:MAG: outer membrane protein assembly factor BamE [Gammaproteobacteria bacterium]|nr:outer membrane protein assembly factor BamE [Gammaproteobacteria bacterium]